MLSLYNVTKVIIMCWSDNYFFFYYKNPKLKLNKGVGLISKS